MTYTLVAIDASGIQNYMFGSNKLPENIGASEIVARATEQWIFDSLKGLNHNLVSPFDPSADNWFTSKTIEDNLEVEVIYAGGGNALLLFKQAEPCKAKAFTEKLTTMVIEKAPGLVLSIAHHEWIPDNESFREAYDELMGLLATRKAAPTPSTPLLGLSVTATCQSTGLPAVTLDKDSRLISAETQAKLAYQAKTEIRMGDLLEVTENRHLKFVKDFNELGTHHESSYLAIVHADGNSMGSRIEKILASDRTDREMINQLRAFSQSLRQASKNSLKFVVDTLINKIDWHDPEKGKLVYKGMEIVIGKDEEGCYILPFRPLIVGGDDTTFVTDGRLGLTLTALYLQKFEEQTLDDGLDQKSYACAGIAIVHNHFPFGRAYRLSEKLCAEAKKTVLKKSKDKKLSALDWHFGVNGVIGTIQDKREQDYMVKEGSLTIRPLLLKGKGLRYWSTFRQAAMGFQDNKLWPRNKIKKLREVLRDGDEATKRFLNLYRFGEEAEDSSGHKIYLLPDLAADPESRATGWKGETCAYFDAIEAADFFIDLEWA